MASQTIAGPDLQFTQDNKRCFAYSGDVTVGASATQMLKLQTQSEYIVSEFEYHGALAQIGQNQIALEVTLNGISVIHTFYEAAIDHTLYDTPPKLIIPPFTEFIITLAQASGSDRTMQVTLTGNVYEYLPVRN